MSDVQGTNYALADSALPSAKVDAPVWGGRVKCQVDTYEAAALASGSTIRVARIPKGAVLLPQSSVHFDALGDGTTLAVGDGTTANKYKNATSVVDAGTFRLDAIDGIGAQLSADTDVVLTVGGGAITGTIKTFVQYTTA